MQGERRRGAERDAEGQRGVWRCAERETCRGTERFAQGERCRERGERDREARACVERVRRCAERDVSGLCRRSLLPPEAGGDGEEAEEWEEDKEAPSSEFNFKTETRFGVDRFDRSLVR